MVKGLFIIFAFALSVIAGLAQQPAPLRLLRTVPLLSVHGRIDHFDIDLPGHRLFMSALGNNTLEVFDLRTVKLIHTIRGLHEPQGVTYAPKSQLIFVANGTDGTCSLFNGRNYRFLKNVHFSSDADDTRYDPRKHRVFVGYGDHRDAGLGILDAATGNLLGTIKLPNHPESFQLEESGPRIFVNIPSAGNIIDVVNRDDRKIIATWTLGGAQGNFPMALDEKDQRLFIATRTPPEVLVLDTGSGSIVSRIPSVSQADDMWYDAAHKRIYISGGGGFISVVTQEDSNHYRRTAEIKTMPGGRTSFFAPQLNRLYLGVWGRGGQPEELRVYEIQR